MEKVKGTPEQQQYRRKLVDALRSGKYEQGQGYLRMDNNFCCLGVACDISGAGEWERRDGYGLEGVYAYVTQGKYDSTSILPDGVPDLFGFTSVGDFPGVGIDGEIVGLRLYELNDDGLSFNQIADLIEDGFEVAPSA